MGIGQLMAYGMGVLAIVIIMFCIIEALIKDNNKEIK
jgi:hypothetical protein